MALFDRKIRLGAQKKKEKEMNKKIKNNFQMAEA